MPPGQPFVSVIVPVYNDSERVRACVEALDAQTYPVDQFEIIVVDNGSTSPPTGLAARARLRLESEPRPGSYAARNRGISVAAGEVLAFTDADCLPTPLWLERGVAALSELGRGAVGGRIEVKTAAGSPRTAVEAYEALYPYRQDLFIREEGFAQTANLFTTRETMTEVGEFRADLLSGGDLEWCGRLPSHGLALRYAADAVVLHGPRRTLRQLLARSARLAGGRFDTESAQRRLDLAWAARRLWRQRPRLADLVLLARADLPPTLKLQVLVIPLLLEAAAARELAAKLRGRPSRRE